MLQAERKWSRKRCFGKSHAHQKSHKDEKQKVVRRKCRVSHAKFCVAFYERNIFLCAMFSAFKVDSIFVFDVL